MWIQTRVCYRQYGAPIDNQGSLQTRVSIDKGTLQTRGPYRQGTSTDAVQFLQTMGPHMIYRQGCKWPHRQGSHTEQGALTDAVLQERGPYKQGTPTWYTSKGPLLTKGSIPARGHNLSITAMWYPRFQENNPFLICLFFKTLKYRFKSEILLHI